MIITRSPFRLSFFGGGTDYPAWYEKNGGLIIGTSFKRYCYLTCRWLPPSMPRLRYFLAILTTSRVLALMR